MKKIWSTLDFFRKLLLTTQVQYRTGHCIFCGQIFCCCVLKSNPPPVKQKTHLAVRFPVQHQATPSDFVFWGLLLSFWNSFVGLGTISIFIIADKLEILYFFYRQEFSWHLFLYYLLVETRRKNKNNPICCRQLFRRPDWTHWDCRISAHSASLLGHPMVIQLRLLPWGVRDRTWNKCFYHP